jgi:suppressor of G2 allele of SKP1
MMATRSKDPATLASHGKKFMEESKYDEALELYNLAITYKPDSPLYHIQRSICHQRLTKYQEAVDDAEVALFLAHKLGKRELKAQAQLRRGISYFFLHRLGDAEQCLKWSQKLDDKEKSLKLWIPKVEEGLKKCEADDERRKATVAEVPDVSDKIKAAEKSASTPTTKPTPAATSAVKQASGVTMSVDSIKEEWFQSNTHVTFTLYVKGVPKDKAVVSLEPRSVSTLC